MKIIENKPLPRRFRIESLMVSILASEIIEKEFPSQNPQTENPCLEMEIEYRPRIDKYIDIGAGVDVTEHEDVKFEGINLTFSGTDIASYFKHSSLPSEEVTISGGHAVPRLPEGRISRRNPRPVGPPTGAARQTNV